MTAPDPTPLAHDARGSSFGRGHRQLSHIAALEAESIHIIREVAAEFERPVLLFSGGKDSAVMLRLAEKAFSPAPIPFPVMHVDTGHNFPEALEFRDRRIAELGVRLVVASVPDAIAAGRVVEEAERIVSEGIDARLAAADAGAAAIAEATREELLQIQGYDANRSAEKVARIREIAE